MGTMSPDQTEAVAHRWHLEVVQAGKLDVADEILAPDCVLHVNGQEMRGVDAAKQLAGAIRTAFPDSQITHHEAIVSGNRVAIRWTSDATHQGEYLGVPASGKRIHIEGLDLVHLQGGKITELWIEYDNLSAMQQMGAIPAPGPMADVTVSDRRRQEMSGTIDPEMITQLQQLDPQLVQQLTQVNPQLVQQLGQVDPQVVQQLQQINPDLVQQLQQINPQVVQQLGQIDPQVVQQLQRIDPQLIQQLGQQLQQINPQLIQQLQQQLQQINPQLVQQLQQLNPQVVQQLAQLNPQMVQQLQQVDPQLVQQLQQVDIKALQELQQQLQQIDPQVIQRLQAQLPQPPTQ